MTPKVLLTFGISVAAAAWLALPVYPDGPDEAAKPNEELDTEIRYAEALLNAMLPDFAEIVMKATIARWPESETRFFALNVSRLLMMGEEKKALDLIAALPDKKGAKYWAARLEVAGSFYRGGRKSDAKKIYDEFFKLYPKPPKELAEFHRNATFSWARLLLDDGKLPEAAQAYENLLRQGLSEEDWSLMACEVTEIYLNLAESSAGKARGEYLKKADNLIKELLWKKNMPVYFCRGIAFRAHHSLLQGRVDKAQEIVEEKMGDLREIHDAIVAADPDGSRGVLRLSPMPQCRYLLAELMWKEAQAEFRKPKRDDEVVKGLLFGAKTRSGKRNGAGAFNHAINVFVKYPESTWAAKAGEMSDAIQKFVEVNYKAKVGVKISVEQMSKVRAMQFRNAHSKYAEQKYEEAIKDYFEVLKTYPELIDSVVAVENIANSYLALIAGSKDEAKKAEWRLNADAVEGYLAERFAGTGEKALMAAAGDATVRLAAKEKDFGQISRSEHLYREFFVNYRSHVSAPGVAANRAAELQCAGRYADAIEVYKVIVSWYSNYVHHASAFAQMSGCYEKLGDKAKAIESMREYIELEKSAVRRTQARMKLADMFKTDGLAKLVNAETNATPEAVAAAEREGSAQIIRAIKQFTGFAKEADAQLADLSVSEGDRAKYSTLKEQAMFLVGDCWGRLPKPEAKIPMFRQRAAQTYEAYLKAYPTGRYSTNCYVRIGTIYTALGDMAKTKDALERLAKAFPDSPEAKNAKPRLAKSLMEMGLKKEATDIYAEMLDTAAAYRSRQFLDAGRALTDAKSWRLAQQAYDKAIAKAGTNEIYTVAEARVGQAVTSFRQGKLVEAREALDLFMADRKMSAIPVVTNAYLVLAEVASKQGAGERDDKVRASHFGAAVDAVKKLRNYLISKKRPLNELDRALLLSNEINIRQMKAEDEMGLTEAAAKTCRNTAAQLESLLQTRRPSESMPITKFSAAELDVLECIYARMIPLMTRMGEAVADKVLLNGQQYLDYFPTGPNRAEIQNCMNTARARSGKSAVQPAAEAKPAGKTSETENK